MAMKSIRNKIRFLLLVSVSLLLGVIAVITGLIVYHEPVQATYPGYNGKIAFVSDRDRGGGYHNIYVTTLPPGSPVTRLTNTTGEVWDVHPAWSPDGSRIVFARYDGSDYEIMVMNADGTNVIQLTDNTIHDYEPAWSPDGQKIAYASGSSLSGPYNDWEIMVMNSDGSEKTQLTNNTFRDVEPDWSPDGTKIAFEGDWELEPYGPGDAEVFTMNADGSGMTQITYNTISDFEPQWHPDGSTLVYTSRVFPEPEYYPAICVVDISTLTIAQLTNDLNYKWEPSWSPDGEKIAFQRQDGTDGDWEIVVINADGSGFTKLTENDNWDLHPAWQRAPISPVEGQYNIQVETSNLGGKSWQFTYTITNLTETGKYSEQYPLPQWCNGTDMTGLVNFFIMIPNSATISNLVLPEPYTPGPYPPGSEETGWYVDFLPKNETYGWMNVWARGPLAIYPQGEPLIFSFRADNVDTGINEAQLSTYFLDRYVRGLPSGLWYESYFTSIVSPLPTLAAVTNTNDSGPGSFRQAILDANSNPGLDTIDFDIPGSGPHIIQPLTALPEITDPVIIDGYTQTGAFEATESTAASLKIILDGTNAGATAGLVLASGSSTIRGLVINNFQLAGITLSTNGGNTIEGNYIGTDNSGTMGNSNRWGIYVSNSSNNVFGGLTPDARNLISANREVGIQIDGGSYNTIIGNYVGIDVSGTFAVVDASSGYSQQNGINVGGIGNVVGGISSGARNIVSGNWNTGIMISNASSTGNYVVGNYIGTNVDGDAALPNGQGILVDQASSNIIGGNNAGEGNLISGNINRGMQIGNFAINNQVIGNFIGTDASGTAELGNTGDGIVIGSSNNIIGGTLPGSRNVISGNGIDGITILNLNVSGNQIVGNYIGADVTGAVALGNASNGIRIWDAHDNTIGGVAEQARNLISGNGWAGVQIHGSGASNIIKGNYIGTDFTGNNAIPNLYGGVVIDNGPTGNVIGGDELGAGNVISGQTGTDGIRISRTTGNTISGNVIGLAADVSIPLPNGVGISLEYGANNNTISNNTVSGNGFNGIWLGDASDNVIEHNNIGTNEAGNNLANAVGIRIGGNSIGNTVGPDNRIWFNTQDGVQIAGADADFNTISRNSIKDNGESGIDLQDNGNNDILPPVIASVTTNQVSGTSTSPDGSTVEIFQDEGAQGNIYVSSASVTSGTFTFTGSVPPGAEGSNLTATVTDPDGNTSEFSTPVTNNLGTGPPAPVVELRHGDGRSFADGPKAVNYANTYHSPPKIFSFSTQGAIWRLNGWIALTGSGSWVEATTTSPTTCVGVQFWGDTNDGWARVLVDGAEVWTGDTYGPSGYWPGDAFVRYLQISGLSQGNHTIRVERMGLPGGGGGTDVCMYFFGWDQKSVNSVTVSAYSPVDIEVTDPDGLTISKTVNQIPEAQYFESDLDGDGDLDDRVNIPVRKIGNYEITVIPEPGASPTETYTLEFSVGDETVILADDVQIGDIPDEGYIVKSSEEGATSWNYFFEDSRRGTSLYVNVDNQTFQFITPDKEYAVKKATRMKVIDLKKLAAVKYDFKIRKWKIDCRRIGIENELRPFVEQYRCGRMPDTIIHIYHQDGDLKLSALIVDGQEDLCVASAIDKQTKKVYKLIAN